jgi:hypothetical protein
MCNRQSDIFGKTTGNHTRITRITGTSRSPDDSDSSRQSATIDDIGKELIMEVKSSRDTLAAIPAHMARAIRRIAERERIPAAAVIKRMLRQALIAEGELPRPSGNDPVPIFTRIDTGALDGGC